MKKKVIPFIVIVCVLAATVILSLILKASAAEKQPFKNLDGVDIASATVTLNPPGQTLEVNDTELLASLLRVVVIGKRDDSWRQGAGQWVNFTLTMTDGTRLEVAALNPFIVIDGRGYQCVCDPCEALNNYANSLLKHSEK